MRRRDHPDGDIELIVVGIRDRRPGRYHGGVDELNLVPLIFGRAVQHDRARLAKGKRDRLPHAVRSIGGSLDQHVSGAGGADEWLLVETLLVQQVARGSVAGDQDERGAAAHRLDQGRRGVGQTGTLGHGGDAEAAGARAVAVRHHDRAGLVSGGDVAASVLLDEGIHHEEVGVANQAEHGIDVGARDSGGDGLMHEHSLFPLGVGADLRPTRLENIQLRVG
jgi:hypothetical protein